MYLTFDPSQEGREELARRAEELLRRMRIGGNLAGMYYLTDAIVLASGNPMATLWVTKDVYPAVAKKYRSTTGRVERCIRTSVRICWERGGRETLEEIAGHPLERRPTNAEFIDLIAAFLRGPL